LVEAMTAEVAIAALIVIAVAQAAVIAGLWIERARRREHHARSAAILRAAPDLMFVQSRAGIYLDYHAPGRDRLYAPPEHFIGRHMRDVLPTNVVEQVNPLFERVWQSDQPVVGEYVLEMQGEARSYEVRMVRCGSDEVLSIVRDITDRKRVEARLVQSDERYSLATSAGRVGVWDWNLITHEIYVDPRQKTLLGYEGHELADTLEGWSRIIHPDDRPVVLAKLENHINGVTPTYEAEYRVLHKDGTLRWFVGRGTVVREHDRPTRVVGTVIDVTDAKHADEALGHAQAELDRLSRLAAFGEFAASIAHELSQPLTAIVMNARACLRFLRAASPELGETRAALGEVIDAGKRADEIIKRNRALFRRHVVERARVSLNDVVQEVASMAASRLMSQGVKLDTRLERHLPPVVGDRLELCQVLLNLITNAIDAMHRIDLPSRVIVVTTAAPSPAEVHVSVRDAGVGLNGIDLTRLFTTGYTTKPRGTGMGLSICRTIVEAHGGRIGVTGNDGPGATFFFTLPCGQLPADAMRKDISRHSTQT
jgi:PAS domain S-box-containing protein